MNNYNQITKKLNQFIKRFYINELIKGFLLFISIGCLYFLITLLVESFLWLKPTYRTVLFWVFITVEISLLYKFIGVPLFKLFGLQKGITKQEAAAIIGTHFSAVNDKLINLLQLKYTNSSSELLLASIDQKSIELSPVPFKIAINFKKNIQYLKYVAIPLLIFLGFQVSGNKNIINNSFNRIINHNIAYTPPAPFTFIIKNKNLQAIENKNFTIEVTTQGKILPSDLKINFNNESYYLTKISFNTYAYDFKQITKATIFNLSANNVVSENYTLHVIKVPNIIDFKMILNYPNHTGKKDEVIKNTGNTVVPEGTKVKWEINTKTTNKVDLLTLNKKDSFSKNKTVFTYHKRIYKNLNYQITTTNTFIKNHEKLRYYIQSTPDEYPEIHLQSKPDSLNNQIIYFLGKISDDYGLKKLQLVYSQINSTKNEVVNIPIQSINYQQFTYHFPGNLNLKKGETYEYYFQVFDNDAIHKFKKTKSTVFTYNKLTDTELEEKQLQNQQKNIDNLKKTLKKISKQKKEVKKVKKLQKEKSELSWMDKLKIKNVFNKQEKQNELMQRFNKNLQRNLEDFQKNKDDPFKNQLKERLKNQEKEIEKNEKLLDELKKLKDKIRDEDLFDKIEKLSKMQKNQEKSLEQILELTKRYYLKRKFEKLSNDLEELAKKQNELANKPDAENTKKNQEKLNKEFKKLQENMNAIKKDNQLLKKPMQLDEQKEQQESIKKDQEKASDNLEKKDKKKAKKKQEDAAKKIKEMSMSMRKSSSSSSSEELDEDIEMLRQILDNLLHFSFDQEDLLKQFKNLENNFSLPKKLKKQQQLKTHFKHIDDSLFALSLRQPKISEIINKEITEVHFNINKSLIRFADLKFQSGATNQQYALTAANNLANLLSTILNALQNQSESIGKGSCDKPGGKSFSLPDIIEKQEKLLSEMKKGEKGKGENGKKGNTGKQKEGKNSEQPGENLEENNAEKLYEIYKKQQQLKNQLQNYLQKNGEVNSNAKKLLQQMEDIENNLLEKGFSNQLTKQMENLKHNLLKLMKASFLQGKENKKEAISNKTEFINNTHQKTPNIEQYFNEVEILNRQALPLHPVYKKKVKQYFKQSND